MTCRSPYGAGRVLLRLDRPSPRLPAPSSRASWAASVAVHVLVIGLATFLRGPSGTIPAAVPSQVPRTHLTWVSTVAMPLPALMPQSGGGGGGGGGGDGRRARGTSTRPVVSESRVRLEPSPLAARPLAMMTFAADVPLDAMVGTPPGLPMQSGFAADARGGGSGGGFGTGEGTGFGAGAGRDAGAGSGGGRGGGVYRPGGAVTPPIVVTQVLPTYPEDAVRSRAQGSVTLQAIVRRNGIPDSIRVVHPLDGGPLDSEAERVVRLWRFRPGTRNGVPVDVLVTVIVDFALY
jgi:protein TonB